VIVSCDMIAASGGDLVTGGAAGSSPVAPRLEVAMSLRVVGRRLRRWQVMTLCLAVSVAVLSLLGWGTLASWQGVTDNPNLVTAAAAAGVTVTSVHCSGTATPYSACSDTSGDVMLSWPAVSGSTGITVERATSPTGTYSTIATLAGTATSYTDTTAAYNTQYYYEVYSGAGGWVPAADIDMALSLPPTAGIDDTAGTEGTAFTAADLTAMSTATGSTYTTAHDWGGTAAEQLGGDDAEAVSCPSTTQCWAVSSEGDIWVTSDGGESWTEQESYDGVSFYGVDCVSTSECWAAGSDGTIYATTDGGVDWIRQLREGGGTTFYGVAFANADDGWAVGSDGAIYHTTDGGTDWTAQTSGTDEQLNGISCASATDCWAVGDAAPGFLFLGGGDAVIVATTNGGNTWTAEDSRTTEDLGAVSCVSTTQCWAVGNDGTIVATTDGGTDWTAETSGTTEDLNAVSCVSTTVCVAVGDGGTVLTTTDGGNTWTAETSGTTGDLEGISCASATQCVIVGDDGTILVGSGSSWEIASAQYVEWTFSPTVASGAAVTSAVLTLVSDASANPSRGTTTSVLVSTNSGSTWTSFPIANETRDMATQTLSIVSVVSSATAVSGMEIRYVVTGSNAFTSTFGLVHVDIN
jgi:photosystem II stability/assembly factor-like uncharacterized protein